MSTIKRHSWSSLLKLALTCLLTFATLPALASSEESYTFERMWPTLKQPWYFNNPRDIAVDKNGNVYVADSDNFQIMKFSADGSLITMWGNRSQFMSFPNGIDVDSEGNVYVAEINYIYKFSSNGTMIARFTNGFMPIIYGVAVDSEGYVYTVATQNYSVMKFRSDGALITEWSLGGSKRRGPNKYIRDAAIAIDASGNVYVAESWNHRVQKFASDGKFIAEWSGSESSDGKFLYPEGIAVDAQGYVYVSDFGNNRIQKFSPEGEFITKWDGLESPKGIAVDAHGNVYVTEESGGRVQKFSSAGRVITTWSSSGSGEGEFIGPRGIALDKDENVYVMDNSRIQKFTPDGKFIIQWGTPSPARDMAVDLEGYIYFLGGSYHEVKKYGPDGSLITRWGSHGHGKGQFHWSNAITVDTDGNVYVTECGNDRVQKFASDGTFITKWKVNITYYPVFPIWLPLLMKYGFSDLLPGIAADKDGNVYVVNSYDGLIMKYTSDGIFITEWKSPGCYGISVGPEGDIYVADKFDCLINQYTPDGKFISSIGSLGSNPGQMSEPRSLAIGYDNTIYVADTGNNRVQVFTKGVTDNETDNETETESDNATCPEPKVPNATDKAIIVAGGGPFPGNNLWDATQINTNFAYRALTFQGFTKEAIYYLTADTNLDLDGNGLLDDVDADATNDNLEYAITQWAVDAHNVVVYITDHGGSGTFRMSGTEILDAEELDGWLDELQESMTGILTVVYDACHSGSFLPVLRPPECKKRITIASASEDEAAYFVTEGIISFSNFFWNRVFDGNDVYKAFTLAKNAMEVHSYQNALLDDTGNGIGNEKDDGTLAREYKIGNGVMMAGDIPAIGSIVEDQTLHGDTSALIWVDNIITTGTIVRVWAVIVPPEQESKDASEPVTELPTVELADDGSGKYEGTYSGFTTAGTYTIAVYAMDKIGAISLPVETAVFQEGS